MQPFSLSPLSAQEVGRPSSMSPPPPPQVGRTVGDVGGGGGGRGQDELTLTPPSAASSSSRNGNNVIISSQPTAASEAERQQDMMQLQRPRGSYAGSDRSRSGSFFSGARGMGEGPDEVDYHDEEDEERNSAMDMKGDFAVFVNTCT